MKSHTPVDILLRSIMRHTDAPHQAIIPNKVHSSQHSATLQNCVWFPSHASDEGKPRKDICASDGGRCTTERLLHVPFRAPEKCKSQERKRRLNTEHLLSPIVPSLLAVRIRPGQRQGVSRQKLQCSAQGMPCQLMVSLQGCCCYIHCIILANMSLQHLASQETAWIVVYLNCIMHVLGFADTSKLQA